MNDELKARKRQLEDELASLRDRNREDALEIERLNISNDLKGKESVELAARIRSFEYDISKSLARIDDLTRIIDQKTYDLKSKEATLIEAESELAKLRSHLDRLEKDLAHLKALEERYRQENSDL